MLEKILEVFGEVLLADGFDEAIIGVETNTGRVVYSETKCIDILSRQMEMEEAIEFFSFNVSGSYVGEKTPIFVNDCF